MVGEAEILVLDQDVGREEEGAGRPDQGGVVADAEQDVAPVLAEKAPDHGHDTPLAEVLQSHRALPEELPPSGAVPSLASQALLAFFFGAFPAFGAAKASVMASRRTSLTSST